jgi:hypothetical protein
MIDYVVMSSRYRSLVEVACVKWGATMYRHGQTFDHGLVEIKFRAWLHRPPTPKPRRDLSRLASLDRGGDEEMQKAFDTTVRHRLDQADGDGSVEDDYTTWVEVVVVGMETLPLKKPPAKWVKIRSQRTLVAGPDRGEARRLAVWREGEAGLAGLEEDQLEASPGIGAAGGLHDWRDYHNQIGMM